MDPVLWSLVCTIGGVLCGVIVMLWRELERRSKRDEGEIASLKLELAEERKARLQKSEAMTEWALGLEEKEHQRVMALATIAEVVNKRIVR